MKHHDLGSTDLPSMISRVIKLPAAKLRPILIGQPISIPKRRPNISRVAGIRSLFLLLTRKNRPIHHRTISDNLLNPRIKRSQKSRRPAKTSPNHKHFIQRRRQAKAPPKSQLAKLFRQPANNIQNVQMRRAFQKQPATLPGPAIPWIKHPISLRRKKLSQRLLARNRRHPIAKYDHPLNSSSPRRRQEFINNVACKSSSKHVHNPRLHSSSGCYLCNPTSNLCPQ